MAKQQTTELYPIRVCAAEGCVHYTDTGVVQGGKTYALCGEHRNADGIKSASESDTPLGTSLPRSEEPTFTDAQQPDAA